MRAVEIFENENLQQLAEMCIQWIELSHNNETIRYILEHPFSQQFKNTNAKVIYRCVFAPYKKFLIVGSVRVKRKPGQFISYSTRPNWGSTVRDDFDYTGDILRFKKDVRGGVVLNFSALTAALEARGYSMGAPSESEVWMEATPYYTIFHIDEFVDADLRNGTTVDSSNLPVSPTRR